jgi:glucoamylase
LTLVMAAGTPSVRPAGPASQALLPPVPPSAPAGLGTPQLAVATGAPGAASSYDEGRKDCVGTATSTSSKIWFTISDGELSDVYEPTIDNTDVKSMQWVVTNGRTWTDIQSRDMTYTVAAEHQHRN